MTTPISRGSGAQEEQDGQLSTSSQGRLTLDETLTDTEKEAATRSSKTGRRESFAVVTASTTNASFAAALCSDTTASMQISSAPSSPFTGVLLWPECMRSSTTVKSITISGDATTPSPRILFNDFGRIPSAVTFFTAINPIFIPENSTSVGFDAATGFLDLAAMFSHFPSMTGFLITTPTFIGATLPTSLPSTVIQLTIKNSTLSGSIPSTLFANAANKVSMLISVTNNPALTGGVPDGLFASFAGKTYTTAVSFNFSSNGLAGTLPSTILSPFATTYGLYWTFDFSNNALTGSVPTFSGSNAPRSLTFDFSANKLSGSLPSPILRQTPYTLPTTIIMDLSDNKLNGSIPSNLLWSPTSGSALTTSFTLNLRNNLLYGEIPATLLSDASFTTPGLILDLGKNLLVGTIPASLLTSVLSNSTTVASIALDGNNLAGTLSASFLSAVPTTGAEVSLSVANNSLWGAPPSLCWGSSTLSIDISHNDLNESIPSTWGSCRLRNVDVSNNPQLGGTIPTGMFGTAIITSFNASHTNVSGSLPTVTSSSLKRIVFDFDSSLSFCDSQSIASLSSYVGSCSMVCTEASSCAGNFTMCDTTPCATPQAESPIAIPITPSTTCKGSSPSADFVCIDGVWTANSTTTTVLTIPSSVGTVIVRGNVTSSTIVFSGLGGSITIDGCATNLTQVVVEFTQEELKQLGSKTLQTLVTLSGNSTSCTNLSTISVTSHVKGSDCKKLKTEKIVDGGTLSGFFTVDSSGCNRWWIILVSVIAGVIVIGVIVAIVVRVLWVKHNSTAAKARLRDAGTSG